MTCGTLQCGQLTVLGSIMPLQAWQYFGTWTGAYELKVTPSADSAGVRGDSLKAAPGDVPGLAVPCGERAPANISFTTIPS